MVRTVFGTLGLIALGAAIVVGMFAAFGAFGENVPVSSTVVGLESLPVQTNEGAPTTAAAEIGETVTTGDISWTVTDANQESELRRYTYPPKSEPGDYVIIDFTVENGSDQPVTLSGEEITLVDSEGNDYEPEANRNDAFVQHEKNILLTDAGRLKPGETKEGPVNYHVLPSSSGFKAMIRSTDPNAPDEKDVDLGF